VLKIDRTDEPRGFRLAGELDMAGEPPFTEALAPEIGREGDLTLDLSALTFIDSTGIQALIKTAENLRDHGRLILYAPGKTVRRVFELMRLDTAPNVEISEGPMPDHGGT
jgi:anti-anti-sigma factor